MTEEKICIFCNVKFGDDGIYCNKCILKAKRLQYRKKLHNILGTIGLSSMGLIILFVFLAAYIFSFHQIIYLIGGFLFLIALCSVIFMVCNNSLKFSSEDKEIFKGQYYLYEKNPYKALEACKYALVKDPNNLDTLDFLSSLFLKSKIYHRVTSICNYVLNLHPSDIISWENLIATYIQNEYYESAIKTYEQSSENAPNSKKFLYNMGVAYYKKSEYEKALNLLKRALDIDLNFEDAKQLREKIIENRGTG